MGVVTLTGCGLVPGGGSSDVPASALTEKFRLVEDPDGMRAVGHGISFIVPKGWKGAIEQVNADDAKVQEWAVEPVKTADPFAPYVDVSASADATDKSTVKDAVAGFKGVQSLSDSFELLDEGDLDVPGSGGAHQLHFRYKANGTVGEETQTRELHIESRIIFVSLPGDHVTTIRQRAPVGHFGDVDFDAVTRSISVKLTGS